MDYAWLRTDLGKLLAHVRLCFVPKERPTMEYTYGVWFTPTLARPQKHTQISPLVYIDGDFAVWARAHVDVQYRSQIEYATDTALHLTS